MGFEKASFQLWSKTFLSPCCLLFCGTDGPTLMVMLFQTASKITDDEITRFVSILMPVVLHGMYSKLNLDHFAKITQNLAFLRPELVIPPIMERLFTAFETLTEPHKLTANMLFVGSMSRSIGKCKQ